MIDLIKAQYIEVSVIGVVLLTVMLFYTHTFHNSQYNQSNKVFVKLLIVNVIILISDVVIYLLRGHTSLVGFLFNHIACIVFYSMHVVFGYLWVMYCITRLFHLEKIKIKTKLLVISFGLINIIMVLMSPWTEWVYSLDDNNQYARGDLVLLNIFITNLYWIISVFIIVKEIIIKRKRRERNLYLTLLIFPLPTVIANIIQLMFQGLTVAWIASAISLLLLFINIQNSQVTKDELTGLYNRRQADKQLAWEIEHYVESGNKLFVIMADIDNFKNINDQYGHVSGDKALVIIANIVKQCCKNKCFIGRFGGDEFLIIGHSKTLDEIDQLIMDINNRIDEYNQTKESSFIISMSMGYSIYNKEKEYSQDMLVSKADHEMYKIKTIRKQKMNKI